MTFGKHKRKYLKDEWDSNGHIHTHHKSSIKEIMTHTHKLGPYSAQELPLLVIKHTNVIFFFAQTPQKECKHIK